MFYFRRLRRVRLKRPRESVKRNIGHTDYVAHKKEARDLIISRLEYFVGEYAKIDPLYQVQMRYVHVCIRNQRSRWGSCSAKKNLNFNYRLVYLTAQLRDYVIVHELCHLIELNHGHNFWALVERLIPDARILSNQIRRMPMDKIVGNQ